MKKRTSLSSLALVVAGLVSISSSAFAGNTTYIEPPMVSIPAGEFLMGSDRGRADEKPVHKVTVPAFQMGKYEVTIAEFRKFIEATNYPMSKTCTHRIGQRWFGSGEKDGSWDNNIYSKNEYHPVVCISRTDAVNYTKWLSEQTGKHYRLPTEAEWEYTVRAGTNTRFFYGDEFDSSKACQYANLSDMHAKKLSGKLFDAPYNDAYVIQPCSDNEVIISTVGLYKPNPFGVYDLLGNVVERLADCYEDSYNGAPIDGSARVKKDCKNYVARGGSWHWEAFTSSQRMRMSEDFLAALEGFRLALDTGGKQLPSQSGSKHFVKNLAIAQTKAKAEHKKTPAYPSKPQGLRVVKATQEKVILQWNKNAEKFVSAYQVFRQDPQTNKRVVISGKVKKPYFVDQSPLAYNARYSVVALNGDTESLMSDSIDSRLATTHTLPVRIQGEAFSFADGAEVRNSSMEPDNDKIINALGDTLASYQIEVTNSGQYQFAVRVFHSGETQKFELWLGDKRLANPTLKGERGWKTIEGITVELPQGTHALKH